MMTPAQRDLLESIANNPRTLNDVRAAIGAALDNNPATSEEGEEVAWCSPGQLANLMDVDNDGGVYLPIRKTKRGNFTMPLFAVTPTPPIQSDDSREAWRNDVEEAPRDGTRLLLMWHDHENLPPHIELGKFGSAVKSWCNTYGKAFSGEPTHWMALPPSPAALAQATPA